MVDMAIDLSLLAVLNACTKGNSLEGVWADFYFVLLVGSKEHGLDLDSPLRSSLVRPGMLMTRSCQLDLAVVDGKLTHGLFG